MAVNLTIYKGNPYNAVITVTDSAGSAYDLTGKTVFFTVKYLTDEESTDTNALITKTVTVHTTPLSGITALALSTSETNIARGFYKYDIRIYQASPLIQLNSVQGICEVKDTVTKRIA